MKLSRPAIMAIVALLASLALVCLGAWFVAIRPAIQARDQRIAAATSFLDAYSEGDCAVAKAFMDPTRPLSRFHGSDFMRPGAFPSTSETFCQDYKVQTVKVDAVRDTADYSGMSYVGRSVWFDGVFEITNHGVGPYPCPHVKVDVANVGDKWLVTGWGDYWATSIQRLECADLSDPDSSSWPLCDKAPGVSLELRTIDNTTIELTVDGLKQEGIFYIFYISAIPSSYDYFTSVVPIYKTSAGRWVAFTGSGTADIDPWVDGRFVYTLTYLPPFGHDSTWEIRLVHTSGVACAKTSIP